MWVQLNVPKHAVVSQSVVCVATPVQVEPPLEGAGELHSRLRACDPDPQVTLQSPYSLQFDHSPLTTIRQISFCLFWQVSSKYSICNYVDWFEKSTRARIFLTVYWFCEYPSTGGASTRWNRWIAFSVPCLCTIAASYSTFAICTPIRPPSIDSYIMRCSCFITNWINYKVNILLYQLKEAIYNW